MQAVLNIMVVYYRIGSLEKKRKFHLVGCEVYYRIGSLENMMPNFNIAILVYYRIGSLEKWWYSFCKG